MSTYLRQIIKARGFQIFIGMLTTRVSIRLLDDRVDHLDGIIFMYDKPLDGAGVDGALAHHQALINLVAHRRRGFLPLTPHG